MSGTRNENLKMEMAAARAASEQFSGLDLLRGEPLRGMEAFADALAGAAVVARTDQLREAVLPDAAEQCLRRATRKDPVLRSWYKAAYAAEDEGREAASDLDVLVETAFESAGFDSERILALRLKKPTLFFERWISEANVHANTRKKATNFLDNLKPSTGETLQAFLARVAAWQTGLPEGVEGLPNAGFIASTVGTSLRRALPQATWLAVADALGYGGARIPKSAAAALQAAQGMDDIVLRKASAPAAAAAAATSGSKPSSRIRPSRPERRTCYRCGEVGHLRADCPKAGSTSKKKGAAGPSSAGTGCSMCGADEVHTPADCPSVAAFFNKPSNDYLAVDEGERETAEAAETAATPGVHATVAAAPARGEADWPGQYIRATVLGQSSTVVDVDALVDTGATWSHMSKARVLQLGASMEEWAGATIHDLGGTPVEICGMATIPISIGGYAYEVPTQVVKGDMCADLILGASFCRDNRAVPKIADLKLVLREGEDGEHAVEMFGGDGLAAAAAARKKRKGGELGKTDADEQGEPSTSGEISESELEFGDDLSSGQRKRLVQLCNRYGTLFGRGPEGSYPRRTTSILTATIPTMGPAPAWRSSPARSEFEREARQAELDEMEAYGFITRIPDEELRQRPEEEQDFSSMGFCVSKPGREPEYDDEGRMRPGAVRFVKDDRGINAMTKKLPTEKTSVRAVLAKLRPSEFYVSFDFDKAFHQIELAEEDRHKSGFTLDTGERYEYNVLPMGFVNSPALWTTVVRRALGDLQRTIATFMDDGCFGCDSFEEGFQTLEILFQRLDAARLTLSLPKLKLFCKRVKFVGLDVSKDGIGVTRERASAIQATPRPETVKEMRAFIGAAQFLAPWIPHAAAKMSILTMALRKGHRLEWSPERVQAFEAVKKAIAEAEPLAHAGSATEGTLTLAVDASVRALGGVLYAETPKGKNKILGYSGRTLTQGETSASVPDKELMAVCAGLASFEDALDGRKFRLLTDSKAVVGMLNSTDQAATRPRARRVAYARTFTGMKVEHIAGADNTGADAISRLKAQRPPQEWINMAAEEDAEVERRLASRAGASAAPATGKAVLASGRPRRRAREPGRYARLADADGDSAAEDDEDEYEFEDEDEDEYEADEGSANGNESQRAPVQPHSEDSSSEEESAEESASRTSLGGRRVGGRLTAGPHSQNTTRNLGEEVEDVSLSGHEKATLKALVEDHRKHHFGRDAMVKREKARALSQGRETPTGLARLAQFVADGCEGCLATKPHRAMYGASGAAVTAGATGPNQRWSMDFAGPFAWGTGPGGRASKYYVLVVTDVFSGYTMTETMKGKTAEQVVRALNRMAETEAPSGPDTPAIGEAPSSGPGPKHIHGDQDKVFLAGTVRNWAAERGITLSFSSKGHAQGNGLSEKHVQTLKRSLQADGWRRDLEEDREVWTARLDSIVDEYNRTPREFARRAGSSTVSTPYALFKGVDPEGIAHAESVEHRRAAVAAARRAQEAIGLNNSTRRTKEFRIGQEVWWRTPEGAARGPKALKKFKYEGPYRVYAAVARRNQSDQRREGPDGPVLTYVIQHWHVKGRLNSDEFKQVNVQELRPGRSRELNRVLGRENNVRTPPLGA